MWGYPVLAAILGDALIFVQMLFLAALLPLIIDLALPQIQANTRLARVAATSVVLVILFPWIWLSLGYNSSAMLSLLMVSGFVVLVRLPEREHPLTQCAIAGLFFGLAYNFRTEALATAVLVTVAILVRGLATGLWRRALKMSAAFVGVVAAFAAPYVVYTTFVLGVPRLATTNRGAALYFQLGVLPKNPWKIVPNDSFAASEAWEFTDDGPFSLVADEIFTERFRRAVATHPRSFAARALAGLKLCLQRGLYLPRIEELLGLNEFDRIRVDLAREEMKEFFGFRANESDISKAARHGVRMKDVASFHRRLILVETPLRVFYGAAWGALCLLCLIGVFRSGMTSWESLLASAFLSALFLIAMIVATLQRPTTGVLPVALVFALRAHAPGIRWLLRGAA